MKQYLDMCRRCFSHGEIKSNRTGIDTLGYIGDFLRFDMADGFPVLTTKKLAWKTCVGEMLGFLRGYTSAAQFRELGCKVWDANANENRHWLNNPNRSGVDDVGRIYGAQARRWGENPFSEKGQIDQLSNVIDDLMQGIDNRREIVTHWNPSEMDQMSLPPCHLLYQFGIQGDRLCLSMYQRSCDLPLGVPFNIAGYAWLLCVIAHICNLKPGTFNHYLHDIHIYENQLDTMRDVQLTRDPYPLPTLYINPQIKTLEDLETWVLPVDFRLINYIWHDPIKYEFSV